MNQPNRSWTQQRGHTAELAACDFLLERGLVRVEQNFRCQYGEIDLIMLESEILVFIEVRQRPRSHFGTAIDSVTASKCRKIARTAAYYLQSHKEHRHRACRFDVIGMVDTQGAWQFQWVRDAFRL